MIVEVAYASASKQFLKQVTLPENSCVRDAIDASGVCEAFSELQLDQVKVGIFSSVVSLAQPLSEHDRVEIYRPLIVDPKEARRQRARKQG